MASIRTNSINKMTRYRVDFDGDVRFFYDVEEAKAFAHDVLEEADDVELYDRKTKSYIPF